MLDPAAPLALAEHVADAARRLGFETALIGAVALAIHRYTRGTEDVDFAVAVDALGGVAVILCGSAAQWRPDFMALDDEDWC